METAVQVEKDIEDLSSMQKLDHFINLANFYHLYPCQIEKCSNCYFICNLRYLYVQNVVTETESFSELQKLCRLNYGSFYSLRLFLRSLAAIERKRVNLENKMDMEYCTNCSKLTRDEFKKELLIDEKNQDTI